jgi:23S rRNA (cytosine1962-C5)-methyltransferase
MSSKEKYASGWSDYELLDAGGGKKLERWGKVITIRPERLAYFKSGWDFSKWKELAHYEFTEGNAQTGTWNNIKQAPEEWNIAIDQLTVRLELTKFKHLGIFPEQEANWRYIFKELNSNSRFLNLFGYTGIASLFAKKAGADVTHVDSVRQVISWTKKNMELSELDGIRWICEDALKFIEKNASKDRKYDFIIMDPPAFGRGAKGEKWQLEKKLDSLVKHAAMSLNPKGKLVLNTYSPKIDQNKTDAILALYFKKFETMQLVSKTTTGKKLEFGLVSYCEKV